MYQTISSPSADERVDAKFSKRGAVVCGSAIGVNFFLYGILSCSGIHEMELRKIYPEKSLVTISVAASALLGLKYMTGPLVGTLIEKFGCKPLMVFGCVLSATSLITCYLGTGNFWIYTAFYGFVFGIATSFIFLPPLTSLGYFFKKRLSLVTNIAHLGTAIGYMTFALMEGAILNASDLSAVFLFEAGLMLCLIPMSFCQPSKEEIESCKHKLLGTNENIDSGVSDVKQPPRLSAFEKHSNLSQNIALWFHLFSQFWIALAEWSLFYLIPRFARDILNITDSSQISLLMTIYGTAGIFGQLCLGYLADGNNPLIVQATMAFLGSACFSGATFITEFWMVQTFSGITGAFLQKIGNINPAAVICICGLEHMPIALGWNKFFRGLGYIIGPPLLSAMQESSGSVIYSFYLASIFYFFGGLFVTASFFVYLKHQNT